MTVTGLADVKVGDTLILVTGNRHRGDGPATVSRIGSKYLYIAVDGREWSGRFDRKTGIEDGNIGVRAQLYTPARYDEIKQRSALLEQLRKAGIEVRSEVRSDLTTDQLRALLAVMQPEEAL